MKFAENGIFGPSMVPQGSPERFHRGRFLGVLETAERSGQVLVSQWSLNGLPSVERVPYIGSNIVPDVQQTIKTIPLSLILSVNA